jgi:hypothetical protein
MKRFSAAIVVAAACAAGLSTDAAAQADPPKEYPPVPVVLHPQGMMCDGPGMDM